MFASKPEGLEFNQCRLNHTRLALTTQRIDDFLLRGLWSRHATLPPSFRNSRRVAGISRVCTGSSNNPDTVRYTHFLPLMRRTLSSRMSRPHQRLAALPHESILPSGKMLSLFPCPYFASIARSAYASSRFWKPQLAEISCPHG